VTRAPPAAGAAVAPLIRRAGAAGRATRAGISSGVGTHGAANQSHRAGDINAAPVPAPTTVTAGAAKHAVTAAARAAVAAAVAAESATNQREVVGATDSPAISA